MVRGTNGSFECLYQEDGYALGGQKEKPIKSKLSRWKEIIKIKADTTKIKKKQKRKETDKVKLKK